MCKFRIVYQSSDLVGFLSELISFELRQCEGEDVFGVYAVSDVHTDKRFRWFSDRPKKNQWSQHLTCLLGCIYGDFIGKELYKLYVFNMSLVLYIQSSSC